MKHSHLSPNHQTLLLKCCTLREYHCLVGGDDDGGDDDGGGDDGGGGDGGDDDDDGGAGLKFEKNKGKASLSLNVTKFFRASRPVHRTSRPV